MNIFTIYVTVLCHWTFGLFSGFYCLLYFTLMRRAILVLHPFLVIYMHYISRHLGIHRCKVTWLTSATFTSRITMLSCFMFQVEDRASFMISILSCHFPVLLMLMWKMPLSLMRTSIHSLEGEEVQDGSLNFLK